MWDDLLIYSCPELEEFEDVQDILRHSSFRWLMWMKGRIQINPAVLGTKRWAQTKHPKVQTWICRTQEYELENDLPTRKSEF